ncbi:MAG: hypothetical protein JWM85_3620 [Acidimicrobiaceae bacterium]|nr:hypothetical protein [Acidimicrobiaceae bacterium]
MLFDEFDKDSKCSECGKKTSDLASGKVTCNPCESIVELHLAQLSAFQHFVGGLYCLWSFDFSGVVVQFMWSIQRLTKTGDYGKDGYFTNILNKSSHKNGT